MIPVCALAFASSALAALASGGHPAPAMLLSALLTPLFALAGAPRGEYRFVLAPVLVLSCAARLAVIAVYSSAPGGFAALLLISGCAAAASRLAFCVKASFYACAPAVIAAAFVALAACISAFFTADPSAARYTASPLWYLVSSVCPFSSAFCCAGSSPGQAARGAAAGLAVASAFILAGAGSSLVSLVCVPVFTVQTALEIAAVYNIFTRRGIKSLAGDDKCSFRKKTNSR